MFKFFVIAVSVILLSDQVKSSYSDVELNATDLSSDNYIDPRQIRTNISPALLTTSISEDPLPSDVSDRVSEKETLEMLSMYFGTSLEPPEHISRFVTPERTAVLRNICYFFMGLVQNIRYSVELSVNTNNEIAIRAIDCVRSQALPYDRLFLRTYLSLLNCGYANTQNITDALVPIGIAVRELKFAIGYTFTKLIECIDTNPSETLGYCIDHVIDTSLTSTSEILYKFPPLIVTAARTIQTTPINLTKCTLRQAITFAVGISKIAADASKCSALSITELLYY